MRKSRKDNNHKELVSILSQLKIPFVDLSHVGGGIPDGLAWVRWRWEFVEFKNREWSYGKKGLNPNQLEWLSKYPDATVYILNKAEDVINFANGKLEQLNKATA